MGDRKKWKMTLQNGFFFLFIHIHSRVLLLLLLLLPYRVYTISFRFVLLCIHFLIVAIRAHDNKLFQYISIATLAHFRRKIATTTKKQN